MERLFSPCTRYRDLLESRGRLEASRSRTELLKELNLDVKIEKLLRAERAFTYADLHAMSGNESAILWLTPHAAVARKSMRVLRYWMQLDGSYYFSFSADGTDMYALARSPERLLEICDVVLRLLAASVVHSLVLRSCSCNDAVINAPTLAYLMEKCSYLKLLSLTAMKMDANHCRMLGAYSGHLEIILSLCKFTGAGSRALVRVLGSNQGPTELIYCDIDCFVLVDGLRGNSRLKSLTPQLSDYRGVAYQERLVIASGNPDDVNRQLLAIADILRENTGLISCDLSYCLLTDKTWNAVCDSLKAHPTLQVLSLRWPLGAAPSALTVVKSLIQGLVGLLKVNMSIHTIHLPQRHSSADELFRASVIPYLETNRLRPRVHAIQKACPIVYRAKVLGRALFAVRNDANSLWMLLSGNLEVAFLSTAATTTPATNPPTSPAIAVIASNAATAAGNFFSWCLCCC
jgi:hypothetical protein